MNLIVINILSSTSVTKFSYILPVFKPGVILQYGQQFYHLVENFVFRSTSFTVTSSRPVMQNIAEHVVF